jgi:hypothetical protein
MEEETTGNQAFVLAIMGSCFSNTHKGVQAGFGEACTMEFAWARNALSQQALGDMLCFLCWGEFLLCFQASVSFRSIQRVQTRAALTILCIFRDSSECITSTDSV